MPFIKDLKLVNKEKMSRNEVEVNIFNNEEL